MKYLSTFSGIGGFEIGINKAYENYKIVRTNEKQENTLSGWNKSLSTGKGNWEDWNEYPTCRLRLLRNQQIRNPNL